MNQHIELPPVAIPGYEGGPFAHRPELLDEPLFTIGHLYGCAHSEETEEALFGGDFEAAGLLHAALIHADRWPLFALPLVGGHRLYVVYRAFPDDPGVDYLLHHPDWDSAELLASDEGHFHGPGLSWSELETAAFNGRPGGSTQDPHARLLLLLPALGDDQVDGTPVQIVTQALAAYTRVDDPARVAELLLDGQGPAGPAHWLTEADGVRTCDGTYAYRSHGALAGHRLARISAALNPV